MDIHLLILVYFFGLIFNLTAYYVDKDGINIARLLVSFLSWLIVIIAIVCVVIEYIYKNWDRPIIKRKTKGE